MCTYMHSISVCVDEWVSVGGWVGECMCVCVFGWLNMCLHVRRVCAWMGG